MTAGSTVKMAVLLLVFLGTTGVVMGRRLSGGASSLGTFNAGLIPSGEEVENRVSMLTSLIRRSNLDVVCLQEVWRTDTQRQIYSELSDVYPHYVSLIDLENTVQSEEKACPPEAVQAYGACLQGCLGSTEVTCPVAECLEALVPLTNECRLCMLINLPDITTCVTEAVSSYEQSFGLMLLSRKTIKSSQTRGYLGDASETRGFYQATIDNIGDLFCTHLSTAPGDSDVYVGPPVVSPFVFESYDAQQLNEIITLLNSTSGRDTAILMGDFNHGPVVPTTYKESATFYDMPLNYGFMNAHGFYSPYVIQDGRCTFCLENPAVDVTSRVIDHIYVPVNARERVVYSERIWDDVLVSGVPLSDHYGVKLVLKDLTFCSSDMWFCLFHGGRTSFPPIQFPTSHLNNICSALRNSTLP